MARDEQHTPRCAAITGRLSSKKYKDKKVPQRGMGVAQLEKIILEEQKQKNDNSRPPSIPLPPPLPPNHHRPDDATNHIFLSNPKHMISTGGGCHNWSRFRNSEPENHNQNQNQNRGGLHLHHRGYAAIMPTNLGGLPYESNTSVWPPQPNSTQRSQLFQQGCSSSMVNASLGATSSSVMNFQMEPPSIQNYCGNRHPSLWPEEDKMVGMKRPYPFSMEQIPSFNCKFPLSSFSRSDEPTSCSNGGTTSSRENPPHLGTKMDITTKKFTDENHGLTKDFLTLAPPRASPQSHSSSKEKLSPSVGEPTLQAQGHIRDPSRREWLNQQSLHSFFPVAKSPGNSKNSEAGEPVDLNLKL